ncbi:unnamed protein product [Cyclocybe aegerita]|uniref:Uncharacterized protein n=1 Tax=Cyclocybe aegerita TaxID=1973307 RepID=A0A8S0VWR3_CYCAE|nr:unnamed protein product [Cyclocybe aegerita]
MRAEDGPVVHGVHAETGIATVAEVQIVETGTIDGTGKTSDPVDVIEIDAKTTEDGTAVTIDGIPQRGMTRVHRLATADTLKIEKVSLETVLHLGLREHCRPTQPPKGNSTSSTRPNLDPDAPDHPVEDGEAMDAINEDDAAMMATMGMTGFGSTKVL